MTDFSIIFQNLTLLIFLAIVLVLMGLTIVLAFFFNIRGFNSAFQLLLSYREKGNLLRYSL